MLINFIIPSNQNFLDPPLVPPSRVSVLPSRFRRPPIESWALDDQRKNSQPGLKDPTNFLPKLVANCGEDLFLRLHLISGKNDFNLRLKSFRQQKYIISTKRFVKLVKAAKRPPMQNFITGFRYSGANLGRYYKSK